MPPVNEKRGGRGLVFSLCRPVVTVAMGAYGA
ncbi:hypothetical protein SAMN06298210_11067 [Prevotellaceae bacterium KH2P17]|nr:hypothetical protein SAMN06298210_11067 [Prevotellaceae bacterium KH2P17]